MVRFLLQRLPFVGLSQDGPAPVGRDGSLVRMKDQESVSLPLCSENAAAH